MPVFPPINIPAFDDPLPTIHALLPGKDNVYRTGKQSSDRSAYPSGQETLPQGHLLLISYLFASKDLDTDGLVETELDAGVGDVVEHVQVTGFVHSEQSFLPLHFS